MSASREKKQRQEDLGQGLTQKQRKELEEARAQKRKTVAYTVIGIVVAVLVAALLIWNSGIFQSRTTAATVNGHNYTPTDVAYYYQNARNTQYMYAQYGLSSFDPSVSDREQFADADQTKTYYDQFMETALDQLKQVTALVDKAQADGFDDAGQVKEYVDNALLQLDTQAAQAGRDRASYLKAVFGRYMTMGRYKTCLEREALANAYYTAHMESLTYDDAALQDYYGENRDALDTFDYSVCFISGAAADPVDENGDPLKDEEGNTVAATDEEKAAAMEAAKETADALLAELEQGGDFDTLATRYAGQADGNTYDGPQSAVGSSVSGVYAGWLKESGRKSGDLEVVESDGSGYYVVRFDRRYLDENSYGTVDVRHILIKAALAEGEETPSQEAMDAAKARAEELLNQWKAGDATAESFGALASQYSEDPGSKDNGGLYEAVPRGRFFTGFNDWMFDSARAVGDVELIENPQSGQQGWHVVYLEKQNEILWRYTAIDALTSDEMTAWMEELQTDYTAEAADGAKYVAR